MCGRVGVENVRHASHSHKRRLLLLLLAVVKLKTHTLLHVVETFFSCIFVVLYCICVRVCLHYVQMQYCGLCFEPYILLCVRVSAYMSDRCYCGTRCTNTRRAVFERQLQVQMGFESQRVLPCGFFGAEARPRTHPSTSYTARRLLEQGKISDRPHCSFSHITALDSCVLRIFICFVL